MPRRRAARLTIPAALLALAASAAPATPDTRDLPEPAARTGEGPAFAVVAFDSASGSWGVACASGELAIGSRAAYAAADAGALLSLGPGPGALHDAAAALALGASPDSALALLTPAGADPAARLGLAVGHDGRVAGRSGPRLPGFTGVLLRHRFGCAGYGLRGTTTLAAMAAAFEQREDDLGARLLAALQAGERADGDPFAALGHGSASLLVVRAEAEPGRGSSRGSGSDRLTDLRVDLDPDPIGALGRLYARHAETFLPAAHVRYADQARRRGDDAAAAREYAAAEKGFRAAVARAPKDAGALNELAWFLATRGGDPSEALRYAEAAVTARADDPNLLDTLAEAAYRAGNLERAIEAMERAVRLSRGNERYAERLRAFRAAKAALAPASR
jgi:uncharacterized Ntn-hydrolase superfamily protein